MNLYTSLIKIQRNSTLNMSLPFTILLLLIFSISSSYFTSLGHCKIARLGIFPKVLKNAPDGSQKLKKSGLEMYYFNQTLDHFSFTPTSYMTFKQRYTIDFTHWGGAKANAPILAYLGGESSLDSSLSAIGFLSDNGSRFKALLIYIEVCVFLYTYNRVVDLCL